MKRLVLALTLLLGLPAQAFERMEQGQCIAAIEAVMTTFGADADRIERERAQINSQRVTADGFCRLEGRAVWQDAEFDRIEWRAEGIEAWVNDGVPPLALEVRVSGLDPDEMQGRVETDRPFLEFHALLRQDPAAGRLIAERLSFDNGDGDVMTLSAVLDRVYLTSASMLQVSLGSMTLRGVLAELTYSGKHENPFGFDLEAELRGNPEAQRAAAFELMSYFPDSVVDSASRAEFTEFAGSLPNPVGKLEVIFQSEYGIGALRLGRFAYMAFADVPQDNAVEQLLLGATFRVNWTPATGQTD